MQVNGDNAKPNAKTTWNTYEACRGSVQRIKNGEGVGFVFTADDGLFGIDIDKCVHEDGSLNGIAEFVLRRMRHTYAEYSPSGKGVHIIGKGRVPDFAHNKNDQLGLEIYDKGRYFTVTFNKIEGYADEPADAQEELNLICSTYLMKQNRRVRQEMRDKSTIPVIQQGERDQRLFEIAVSLYHKGCEKWQAYAALETLAAYCQPAVDGDTARQKVDSAWKSSDPHPAEVMRRMNARYAMVAGQKGVLVEPNTEDENPQFMELTYLKQLHAPDKVKYEDSEGRVRVTNAIDYWLSHPERRTYDGVCFKPMKNTKNYYNLWRGFRAKPIQKPKACAAFLEHVRKNIAGGDEETAEWVLDWLAGIVQDPGGGPQTSMVLVGAQGVGKTVVGEYLRAMIGNAHFVQLSHHDHFVGRFNADLAQKVLVHCDEATWGGDKRSEGALKALVTNRTITVEMKGKERFVIDNNVHLLVTSNESWPIPVNIDDRRFVLIKVQPTVKEPDKFFERLWAELDGEGPAALLGYLQERKLKSTNPKVPKKLKKGEATGLAKRRGLDSVEKTLVNWVTRGAIGSREWTQVITGTELYASYLEEAKQLNFRAPEDQKSFYVKMGRLLKGMETGHVARGENALRKKIGLPEVDGLESSQQVRKNAGVKRYVVLPSLDEANEQLGEMGLV